jgi:molybdopterin synthase sulfur carrier subunit
VPPRPGPRYHRVVATVAFTPHLQRFLDAPPREVAGATVREVLAALFADNPRLKGYVLDDQGRLRKHVTVFVDGQPLRDRDALSDRVVEGSEVYVLQALSGGAG